jgi:hypothetical protein
MRASSASSRSVALLFIGSLLDESAKNTTRRIGCFAERILTNLKEENDGAKAGGNGAFFDCGD